MKKLAKQGKTLAAVSGILLFVALFFFAAGQVRTRMTLAGTGAAKPQSPTIIIDPGHGGMDGGALGDGGTVEKDINLAISLQLRDFLTVSGYRVIMTRDSDISIYDEGTEGVRAQKRSDMHNRLKIMESVPGATVISIHQNQFEKPQYSGAQMFYGKNNAESKALAENLQAAFRQLQPDNKREIKPAGKELYLLWECENPIVLVECGFISNPEECRNLCSADYQRQAAFAVLAGLLEASNGADENAAAPAG